MPFISSLGGTYGFEGIGGSSLYPFTSHTFSPCGTPTNVRQGPSYSTCVAFYAGTDLNHWTRNTEFFDILDTMYQAWTVPASGSYQITVVGASSRQGNAFGASVVATVSLTQGDRYLCVPGQRGINSNHPCGPYAEGGHGGSFFVRRTGNVPILIAGGAGGRNGSDPNVANAHASLTRSGQSSETSSPPSTATGGANGLNGGGDCTGDQGAGLGGTGFANMLTTFLLGTISSGNSSRVGGFGGGGGSGQYGSGGGGGYSGGQGGGLFSCACFAITNGGGGSSYVDNSVVSATSQLNATPNIDGYISVVKL